jgi:hypothetical protein
MSKVGNYDWIADFSEIKHILTTELELSTKRVLVCGCGTSKLSESVLNDFQCPLVVSVDNDENCINYMRSIHASDTRLKWICCDLNEISEVLSIKDLSQGSFDILLDKGTFDAILVEGTIYQYLNVIYNLMTAGSAYVLCSLHGSSFLSPLLQSPIYNCHTTFHDLNGSDGCFAICRKRSNSELDIAAFKALEEQFMEYHFKIEQPLFTEQLQQLVQSRFHERSLPLDEAYNAIFCDLPGLGYSFELFLHDIGNFSLAEEGYMSCYEALLFIQSMQ